MDTAKPLSRSPLVDVQSLTEAAQRLATPAYFDSRTPIFNELLATKADAAVRQELYAPLHPSIPRIINSTYEIDSLFEEALVQDFNTKSLLVQFLKRALGKGDEQVDKREVLLRAESTVGETAWQPAPGFVNSFYRNKQKGRHSWYATRWDIRSGQAVEDISYRYTIMPESSYRDGIFLSQKVSGAYTHPRMLHPNNANDLIHLEALDAAVTIFTAGVKDKVYKK